MSQLKIEFARPDHPIVESNIADFLNKVLPIKAGDVAEPENKLIHTLLSYHSDEGGAVAVTRVELGWVKYDAEKKTGKIGFKYYLKWYFACSYSDRDYEKNDQVDFDLDTEAGVVTLTFLDLDTRSTAEEF